MPAPAEAPVSVGMTPSMRVPEPVPESAVGGWTVEVASAPWRVKYRPPTGVPVW